MLRRDWVRELSSFRFGKCSCIRTRRINLIYGNTIELSPTDEITNNDAVLHVVNNKLRIYERSNSNTCIHQKSTVLAGELLRCGEVLADGAATVRGESALGRNILVAYMPWEGYNFEDAVLISERQTAGLAHSNRFPSPSLKAILLPLLTAQSAKLCPATSLNQAHGTRGPGRGRALQDIRVGPRV